MLEIVELYSVVQCSKFAGRDGRVIDEWLVRSDGWAVVCMME